MYRSLLLLAMTMMGGAARTATLDEAIAASRPILDARVRYEYVHQPAVAPRTHTDANAVTARLRAGLETGRVWNTALLIEGEFIDSWVEHYNSTANGRITRPLVADPSASELNRFQLTNTGLRGTTVTLGRQRINLDDQRFVGNSGWRQNEQTFDALRVAAKPTGQLVAELIYANQVNRVFGEHALSQLPKFKGDVWMANVGYVTPVGRLTGFGYLLDLGNSAVNSSATVGARLQGEKPAGPVKFSYAASWATQRDYGGNPSDYSASYLLAEAGLGISGFTALLGYEVLGGGASGFATPLATLHKYQGWADVFLVTPTAGIEDRYVSAAWSRKVAAWDSLGVSAAYHDFHTEKGGANLGHELDLLASARYGRFTATLKYAHYSGPAAVQDADKLWFELGAVW